MAIPRSMGWLVVTGVVVLTLVGLSVFALDRPDTVWTAGTPACPHCRKDVPFFAKRCPTCREEFDWVATPEDAQPLCTHCLSGGQEDWVRERKRALGEEAAVERVVRALSVPASAAAEYLGAVGRGQCGACGGTGLDVKAEGAEIVACPVCFGGQRCVGCGGDRRVVVGDEPAHGAIQRYRVVVRGVDLAHTSPASARRELKDAAALFLRRHRGTSYAVDLLHWPAFAPSSGDPPRRALTEADERLAALLRALE